MKSGLLPAIAVFFFMLGTANALTNLAACANLTTAGETYNLTANASISSLTCMNISAANVTLNCNGYSITGNNASGTYGVLSNAFNTTVKNCIISNFTHGIYFDGAVNGLIQNNSVNVTRASGVGIYLFSNADNNIVQNNTASSRAFVGIRSWSSSNVTLANNNGTSTSYAGIQIYGASNSNITGNIGTSTSSMGFSAEGDYYSTYSNNTGISTSGYGVNINAAINSNYTNMAGTSTSNYGVRFYPGNAAYGYGNRLVNTTASSATSFGLFVQWYAANNTFIGGSAKGTYAIVVNYSSSGNNFTNMTFNGTTADIYVDSSSGNNLFYYNNISGTGIWVNNSNSTNSFNTTIDSKGVGNIYYFANNTGAWATFDITDTDANGYADSGSSRPFNATTVGGNWSGVGGDWFPYSTNTRGCANLTTAGQTYTLLYNLSISGQTCMNISAANVTLNCAGYSITGSNTTSTYGVYSNQFNTTVKNCVISNFSTGIYFDTADNGTIQNTSSSTTHSTGYGIYLYNSANYNNISNSTGTSTSNYGIYLQLSSNNNFITNSTGTSTSNAGILLFSSSNNTLTNSTFTSTSNIGIYLYSSSNNILTNSTGTSTSYIGILLNSGSYNTITNSNGTSNSSYGIRLASSSNNTLTNSTGTSTSDAGIFLSSSSNNTLTNFTGTSTSSRGIYLYGSSNNTITNSTGTSTLYYGISLDSSSNNTIANSTFRSNGTSSTSGVAHLVSASSNLFSNNTINSTNTAANAMRGIYIASGSNNNFTNNTIVVAGGTTTAAIQVLAASANNLFHRNNIDATVWVNNSNETNQFNTSLSGVAQGNNYTGISAYAIFDQNSDGWGDAGAAYPLNATSAPIKWIGFGTDYGPAASPRQGPSLSVSISPSPAYPSSTLSCQISATDNYETSFTANYTWIRNGQPQSSLSGTTTLSNNTPATLTVSSSSLSAGSEWFCHVSANNSLAASSANSNIIFVIMPQSFGSSGGGSTGSSSSPSAPPSAAPSQIVATPPATTPPVETPPAAPPAPPTITLPQQSKLNQEVEAAVTTPSGAALPNAKVTVITPSGRKLFLTTDANGKIKFFAGEPGDYVLTTEGASSKTTASAPPNPPIAQIIDSASKIPASALNPDNAPAITYSFALAALVVAFSASAGAYLLFFRKK